MWMIDLLLGYVRTRHGQQDSQNPKKTDIDHLGIAHLRRSPAKLQEKLTKCYPFFRLCADQARVPDLHDIFWGPYAAEK